MSLNKSRLICVLCLLTTAYPAFGAQLIIIPQLSDEASYDTNVRMEDSDKEGGFSNTIEGRLDMNYRTERTSIELNPRARLVSYPAEKFDTYDSDEYGITTRVNHDTERSQFGARALYSLRNSLRSEFDPAIPEDPDEPPPPGSGIVTTGKEDQQRWVIAPYFSHRLSEKNNLRARLQYMDVHYDQTLLVERRFDYDELSGEIDLVHRRDRKNEISAGVFASDYESEASGTKSVGARIGYVRNLSPTSTLRFRAGAVRSELTGIGDHAETNFAGDILWRKRGETVDFNLGFSSGVTPTSQGSQSLKNEIRMYVDRRFNQRLNGRVGLVAYRLESFEDSDELERDYVTAQLVARWQLARKWSLTASYQYRLRDQIDFGESIEAEKHQFRLGILWRGTGRR